MNKAIDALSRLVTARPWLTLLVLLIITVGMTMGTNYRLPPTEGANLVFLPEDHPVADASAQIDERFGANGTVVAVTLLFRGDVYTPEGLAQMAALLESIAREPGVAAALAPDQYAIVGPSTVLAGALQTADFSAVTQSQIDSVRAIPQVQEALEAMTGAGTDGDPVSIANVRLLDTGAGTAQDAERAILDLAVGSAGPVSVSSLSGVIVEDEYKRATEEGMAPLVGLALLLIALLLLLFTRSISDTLITLLGLVVSIMWVLGAEGWMGPSALGIIGPPSSLTVMVPVFIISLTVDYAIQAISHYREQRLAGESAVVAVQSGLRDVTTPLVLAALTTIVGLLANLFSPIDVIADFGVVAGLGVGMSLIVMLTLVPATRVIIDRRREARGRLGPARSIAGALPGVERGAAVLGRWVTRTPVPYIIGVLVVTAALGIAATDLKSEFQLRDILPNDSDVVQDMVTLESAIGGAPEMASVLVIAEATETRTLLNLQDLRLAIDDPQRRPQAIAGPVRTSYEIQVEDWTTDSGAPGDNYDPELATLFREASTGVQLDPTLMQEFLDKLMARDPAVARGLVNDPNGLDAILIQFPIYWDDTESLIDLQGDIEALWVGNNVTVTVIAPSIVAVVVTNAITDRQTEGIGSTVAAALIFLAIFFWLTARQPGLAVIAVGPVVLVLVSVLGTMALLNIPYSLITSIITALTIGIGVDYTIHIIHRYREEFTRSRSPERAAIRTLATTGSALLGSAMTTALGFGVLMASPLLASQQFAMTAVIAIVYSLICSVLLVLPAMVTWGAIQNMRLRAMAERYWDELDTAIEGIHQTHEREHGSA